MMEEVAFNDWPGQPVDVNSGNNPWLPAYGFQTPTSLLEKDDFLGNPDADYFFQGASSHYMYLETIQEETSDDLQSESDYGSNKSPVGWLATDSESGSVICIDPPEDIDCDSDRELACPAKRRKQDLFLTIPTSETLEETDSISRSSSLLQFETFEKQCQENPSPSVISQFSFDSLETGNQRTSVISPDSLTLDDESDYYKTLKIDIPRFKMNNNNINKDIDRDSFLFGTNATRYSFSDSSDSDTTLDGARSFDNLKTWRSFDSLPTSNNINNNNHKRDKISAENLSEDSGYSDHLTKSSSASNLETKSMKNLCSNGKKDNKRKKNSYVGFTAYDGEVIHENFNGNFGVSYQDLSIFDKYEPAEPYKKSLIDSFLRKKLEKSTPTTDDNNHIMANAKITKLDRECGQSIFNTQSASVPNLLETVTSSVTIENTVCFTASVPKNLNFISEFTKNSRNSNSVAEKNWNLANFANFNFDDNYYNENSLVISDHSSEDYYKMATDNYRAREGSYTEAMSHRVDLSDDENSLLNKHRKKLPKTPIVEFDKRILKAISEQSIQNLASTSNLSLHASQKNLKTEAKDALTSSTAVVKRSKVTAATSTPNLNRIEAVNKAYNDEERRKSTQEISRVCAREEKATQTMPEFTPLRAKTPEKEELDDDEEEIFLLEGPSSVILPKTSSVLEYVTAEVHNTIDNTNSDSKIMIDNNNGNYESSENALQIARKGSIIKSSTSTSGMSDIEDKTLRNSVKSFTGSTGSKGVHFSPVVSEVNWRDDGSVSTATPERESSFSLDSSSPEPEKKRKYPTPPANKIVRPKPRYGNGGTPIARLSVSQPDLSDTESLKQREFLDSLHNLRQENMSKSQPDVSRCKRRGSQLIKKDKDGCLIKAYVDGDGIQYQHTHLDLNIKSAAGATATASNSNVSAGPHYQHQQQNNNTEPYKNRGGFGNNSGIERKQLNTGARVTAMDSAQSGKNSAKSGKLGGFFQRLASFRFSAKKGAEEKAAKSKKKQQAGGNAGLTSPFLAPNQRVATKEDYIYIPLKGPPNSNIPSAPVNNNNSISSKPPLPKQPPRVVHASVKKSNENGARSQEHNEQETARRAHRSGAHAHQRGFAAPQNDRNNRRKTIDSMETQPMGLIETDLDTEVTVITSGAGGAKTRSLLNLGADPANRLNLPQDQEQRHPGRPHKSMEFLLDKQNLKVVEPPENELQKGERVMSEHQLRVQRSLQKLTVPEWYKQSQVPREGFLLKKNSARESRWTGTSNKTTSLSSLGSSNQQSPVVLSPTPCNQSFVRWSTSKLNSTASSPCQSTRSSFNTRQPNGSISPSSARSSFSYRQPYLGWRSQERLSRPRTPAERLASSILASANSSCRQNTVHHPQESPEIQTSIKEVTSAIVHYVSGLKPDDVNNKNKYLNDSQENISRRSSSVSPRGSQKLCWLESSFVGTKPLDSPQTPVTFSEGHSSSSPVPSQNLRLELQGHNDLPFLSSTGGSTVKPSPSSTTLEDVLDSLLGLPSSGRAASPCLQETASASTSPNHHYPVDHDLDSHNRRRSEGSQQSPVTSQGSRRVSFDSTSILRCRYPRCGKTAFTSTAAANSFKNCHNCSFTYCSRACRRAHWEKHRKTCLFSRIGSLCRQVIAASKEQRDTLKHLSKMARRGCISHGPGAVKCFFPNPDSAEKFLTRGLPSLGELTFVPWQDLLPSEMGPQLYEELVKMCKSYNPDTKLVLYVSICVVSETPSSGCVKWERQLVSRCAKMRLSRDVSIPDRDTTHQENLETLVLTCAPITYDVLESRKIAVENLQRHLKERNVMLKRQHPEVFRQLSLYCEDENAKFHAVNVYPKDTVTGRNFMCIIMLESSVESLRKVENAGVKVRTLDVLSEKTAF